MTDYNSGFICQLLLVPYIYIHIFPIKYSPVEVYQSSTALKNKRLYTLNIFYLVLK